MARDPAIRASDRDRDAVVDTLRSAFTEGRLTLEEFNERVASAYAGRTWGELRTLTADLPVQPALGADLPPGSTGMPGTSAVGRPHAPGEPVSGQHAPGQPGVPVSPYQGGPAGIPPSPPHERRARPIGIIVPIAMWVMVAYATRSVEGALFFVIALVLMVTFAAASRRRR